MKTLARALGAIGFIRSGAKQSHQPGLVMWADTTEKAVRDLATEVSAGAYQNEHVESEMAKELRAMLADGKIDASELKRLSEIPGQLTKCADRSHAIGEIVTPPRTV